MMFSKRPPKSRKPERVTRQALSQPVYDVEWILHGLRKAHVAYYSPVICFEANDPERLKQLKEFFCSSEAVGYEQHDTYFFEPWNGLTRLDKNTKQTTPESADVGKRFQDELGEQIRDLAACFNMMDPRLKGGKTVLVVHGLGGQSDGGASSAERERFLSAVRAWATDDAIVAGRSLVLLVAASPSALLDDETRQLVPVIRVQMSGEKERRELARYLADLFGIPLSEEEEGTIEGSIRGLNLHQAEAVLREAYALSDRFDLERIKRSKSEIVERSGILEVEEPRGGFEAIGGYEAVKRFIGRKIVEVVRHPALAQAFALAPPRGVLFFGPPGTGKTLFAKSLAKAVELPFINFKTENIYGRFLGETGQRMRSAIQTAEHMSPAIVFVDEIDRFGKRTATTDSAGEETRRAFSQLLEWLGDEQRKAVIIGTTNRPDDLDPAFVRAGRFDYRIPLLYPDEEARLDILRVHLGLPDSNARPSPRPKPPLALADSDFLAFFKKEVVSATDSYSGAELAELVNRAKRSAVERRAEAVGPEDFRQSVRSFRVDPDRRRAERRQFEEHALAFTDDAEFLRDLGIER